MALAPRPTWQPLPDPPGPDPALAQDFQTLAGELMPGLDTADTLLAAGLLALDTARLEEQAATVALGVTWAAELETLRTYVAEETPDTLLDALTKAAEQDAALYAADVPVVTAWPES